MPIWIWWTLASVAGLVCLRLPTYLLGTLVYTLSQQYHDTYAWLFDDYILVAYERLLFPALLLAGAAALGYLQCRVLERYDPPARGGSGRPSVPGSSLCCSGCWFPAGRWQPSLTTW